eukprot:363070-Chlamydomonas_euryale.AAC.5
MWAASRRYSDTEKQHGLEEIKRQLLEHLAEEQAKDLERFESMREEKILSQLALEIASRLPERLLATAQNKRKSSAAFHQASRMASEALQMPFRRVLSYFDSGKVLTYAIKTSDLSWILDFYLKVAQGLFDEDSERHIASEWLTDEEMDTIVHYFFQPAPKTMSRLVYIFRGEPLTLLSPLVNQMAGARCSLGSAPNTWMQVFAGVGGVQHASMEPLWPCIPYATALAGALMSEFKVLPGGKNECSRLLLLMLGAPGMSATATMNAGWRRTTRSMLEFCLSTIPGLVPIPGSMKRTRSIQQQDLDFLIQVLELSRACGVDWDPAVYSTGVKAAEALQRREQAINIFGLLLDASSRPGGSGCFVPDEILETVVRMSRNWPRDVLQLLDALPEPLDARVLDRILKTAIAAGDVSWVLAAVSTAAERPPKSAASCLERLDALMSAMEVTASCLPDVLGNEAQQASTKLALTEALNSTLDGMDPQQQDARTLAATSERLLAICGSCADFEAISERAFDLSPSKAVAERLLIECRDLLLSRPRLLQRTMVSAAVGKLPEGLGHELLAVLQSLSVEQQRIAFANGGAAALAKLLLNDAGELKYLPEGDQISIFLVFKLVLYVPGESEKQNVLCNFGSRDLHDATGQPFPSFGDRLQQAGENQATLSGHASKALLAFLEDHVIGCHESFAQVSLDEEERRQLLLGVLDLCGSSSTPKDMHTVKQLASVAIAEIEHRSKHNAVRAAAEERWIIMQVRSFQDGNHAL